MFIKLNEDPVLIERVLDEHCEDKDYVPSFWWGNRRRYLDDFIRCHGNPWIRTDEFPEFIHAYEADEYIHPIFLELVDDEHINIYKEV